MAFYECGFDGISDLYNNFFWLKKWVYDGYGYDLIEVPKSPIKNAKLVAVTKGWKKATGNNFAALSTGTNKAIINTDYFDNSTIAVSSRYYLKINRSFKALILANTFTATTNTTNGNDFRLYQVSATNYNPYSGDAPILFATEGGDFASGENKDGTYVAYNYGLADRIGTVFAITDLVKDNYLLGRQYNKIDAGTVRELYIFDITGD